MHRMEYKIHKIYLMFNCKEDSKIQMMKRLACNNNKYREIAQNLLPIKKFLYYLLLL